MKDQIKELQSKIAQLLSSKAALSEVQKPASSGQDAEIVDLNNKLILAEGEKLKMQEMYDNIKAEMMNTKDELKKKVN